MFSPIYLNCFELIAIDSTVVRLPGKLNEVGGKRNIKLIADRYPVGHVKSP